MLKWSTRIALLLFAAWLVWNLANGANPFSFEAFGIKGSSG